MEIPSHIPSCSRRATPRIRGLLPPHSPYAQTPILSIHLFVHSTILTPAKHFLPACHIPHHVCVGDRAPDRLTDASGVRCKLDGRTTEGGEVRRPIHGRGRRSTEAAARGRRDGGDSVGYEGRTHPSCAAVRAGGRRGGGPSLSLWHT